MKKALCSSCGGELFFGVAHECSEMLLRSRTGRSKINWLAVAAQVVSFLVLFGTLVWKSASIASQLESVQKQQTEQNERLKGVEAYFKKPLPRE